MNPRHDVRIAYIGGGSRYWAYELMSDLAICPHLGGELVLYDIDRQAAETNVGIGTEIFALARDKPAFKVSSVARLETALKGAQFVVCSIEPGDITLRYADLEIPRKHGLLQTVGDTAGPGGLCRALRSVETYRAFAEAIMATCPDAWVINYTNPMTLCTQALYSARPDIQAFGCCHEVFGTQNALAACVSKWFKVDKPDRREIAVDVSGLNHFTMVTSARWQGEELMPRLREETEKRGFFRDRTQAAQARKRKGQWFGSEKLIAFDFLRRFGVLGAAGDRHLAEFVPWYLLSEKELHRWGVVLTPYQWRVDNARQKRKTTYKPLKLNPSGEEGVDQMCALLGEAPLDTNVNLPNRGQMPHLPGGHVVETNARFRQGTVTPVVASPLPPGALELQRRAACVQEMTLEAAIDKDVHRAFEALLNDPLTRLSTDEAWTMFKAMLRRIKDMLPGWRLP